MASYKETAMPLTTCDHCGLCYEASSDECANEPGRLCPDCRPSWRTVRELEQTAAAALERGDMYEHDRAMADRRRIVERIERDD